jgi:putative salt-induced outer membrane protein
MPAHNSVWTHDNQGCAPIRPRIGEQPPKESISVAELGTFYGALEDRQLLAECQILERDRPLSTADERERSKRDDERSLHRLSCLAINHWINGRRSDFGERQPREAIASEKSGARNRSTWGSAYRACRARFVARMVSTTKEFKDRHRQVRRRTESTGPCHNPCSVLMIVAARVSRVQPSAVSRRFLVSLVVCLLGVARSAAGQPAAEPPPAWEVLVGGAFVGTSGNTDTSTVGADFVMNRRWPVWQFEAAALTISTSDQGEQTAERYLAAFRARRPLTSRIGLSIGERLEGDRFAGIDFRSILDGGLTYVLVRRPRWTLDGLTSAAWNHESRVVGDDIDHPIGLFQAVNKFVLGPGAETTQRFNYYPDFKESSAYRSEAEITAQAAMNSRLALRFGYLWRYSNTPVAGFVKSDNTTTASLVLRWRAANPAP